MNRRRDGCYIGSAEEPERNNLCGIIAGISEEEIAPILLEGLRRVEYRGYDSAGVATLSDGRLEIRKEVGRIDDLEGRYRASGMKGRTGISHTRWATHGGVTQANAHPHASCDDMVAVVHNGIIENYLELRERLIGDGHVFKSETDTEVIPHLIEEASRKGMDPLAATLSAVRQLKGQYAIVAMFRDHPEVIMGARNDAPLVVGVGEREMFLASDVLAFISRTDRAVFLDNMEVVELTARGYKVFNTDGVEVEEKPTQLAWELSDLSKLDYAHYTLKEIHEQSVSVERAFLQDGAKLDSFVRALRGAKSVILTASGSSYHAAMLLKDRLNREGKIRCDAVLAGEFEDTAHFVDKGTVVVAFSQSGETADLLHAVKVARAKGASVISVVNAAGSSLARESDEVLTLNCGPEVGVAATKSFTAQVMVGNVIADAVIGKSTVGDLDAVRKMIEETLATEEKVREIAKMFRDRPDFYFIARGHHYPLALEGALKLKELSYIHAEGMPASELKHGTLALIEKGTPVVVLAPGGEGFESTISNALELEARGAEVIGISDKQHPVFRHRVGIPRSNESISPILEVIPLQFLAYFMATERKNDPDYPRNLAKSVTVR
jgi:glucosamine--fructose-6-phosphate aminotransferase (isomerizing)